MNVITSASCSVRRRWRDPRVIKAVMIQAQAAWPPSGADTGWSPMSDWGKTHTHTHSQRERERKKKRQ